MQTHWIEIVLMAGGVASIVALFVSEAARHRRSDGFLRGVPGSRRIDPPHRQAADYRVSGVLPTWRA
jgi:hypothetical protein